MNEANNTNSTNLTQRISQLHGTIRYTLKGCKVEFPTFAYCHEFKKYLAEAEIVVTNSEDTSVTYILPAATVAGRLLEVANKNKNVFVLTKK